MNIENKRRINEKKFINWEKLPDGGRKYYLDVKGRHGWIAKYVKEVDADEETLRFFQEIYNEKGRLIEIHDKFPVDKGHKKLKEE
ncbi:MAG: hypothetical protein A2161_06850 [Candidatus Schekmanbacteria bacterium RBG_13_48_7]|uniref:Uncharacterized protein n=1 Tax=Candidatus Schekmanbacteria bacterium RBG_13_48_7 TaxID=1817878 RepID=A0A1F7S0N0_9BACT|nr:MAG: hypothetical protein A2161_06850 [Candidatus Schekmanbacteria bacterium RBG_13_48_7]